jgi:hypothetical protein
MTVETAGHAPATRPRTLNEALAALQGRLPRIAKTETAEVPHKDGGRHEYSYADLAAVTHAAMPIMSELGLSFTSAPTLMWNDEHPEIPPRFVLAYTLRHTSGESVEGYFPLPSGVGSQAMGSAITYARRYSLCAVTGIAPEDDDDAAAADAGLRQQARETQAPRQGGGKLRSAPKQDQEQKPEPEPDRQSKQAQALADLAVRLTGIAGKTVDDLRDQVYKPAESKRILRAQVIDPITGERTQLTAVISAAKSVLESAAERAGAAQS